MHISVSGFPWGSPDDRANVGGAEVQTNRPAVHAGGSIFPATRQPAVTQSAETRPNSYDSIAYPRGSHRSSHPRTAEAIATLFGMETPPLSRCRVLKLGCAAGWNLIPQAVDYSASRFVGVDLSQRQIDEGQSMVQSLGLDNIELRQVSILDIDRSWGEFDYIICHGVYSWVDADVRDKILAICKENLSPHGVAYFSYNVYPGWGLRGTIRDMMLYHTAQFDDPHEQISQAREVLDFMAENCAKETPYGRMLKQELDDVRSVDDADLFHDHMAEHNFPVYFSQFDQHAESKGLQYLADTDFASMLPKYLTAKANAALANAPLVKQEQYMDFLRNRTFRRTLLCHANVPLARCLQHEDFRTFRLLLASQPEHDSLKTSEDGTTKLAMGTRAMTTRSTLVRSALEKLIESWPRAITLDGLHLAAINGAAEHQRPRCDDEKQIDSEVVAGAMMDACVVGLLEFFLHPPRVVDVVGQRPEVNPWVRLQARCGPKVTNQLHENITLEALPRLLAVHLDGHHDRRRLLDRVQQAIADGRLQVEKDGQSARQITPEILGEMIDAVLIGFRKSALLTA